MVRMMLTNRRSTGRRRRGAVALEFAILISFFLLLLFGMIELGRAIQVSQILTNAAREGARRAIVPGATNTQVEQIISTYMTAAAIPSHETSIQINGTAGSLATAASHDELAVRVSTPYASVSWGVMRLIPADRVFSATVTTRKE
jgi:Flp pilus assembly protein TadG